MTPKEAIKCEKCLHQSVCEKKTCAECQGSGCDECELYDLYNGVPYIEDCEDFIDADLINRQKAEISVLRKLLDKAETEMNDQRENINKLVAGHRNLQKDFESANEELFFRRLENCELADKIEKAEAEAIKELMFNLDNEISTYSSAGKDLNVYAWLKDYVKEKAGEG